MSVNLFKRTKLKYPICIQTLYSVFSWSTFGSNYSLESFWAWRNKLWTPGLGDFLPFFFANPLKLGQVGWGPSVDSHFQVFPEMFKSGLWLGHSRTGVSNPAPGELPSWRFQLQPQSNTPEPANQGVQGYLIITDRCVAAGLELKSAGR